MDIQALFKIQCGLYVAAVSTPEKMNGCITNTLMQQSHAPVKLSVTVMKKNLTHDMILQKGSVALSALSGNNPVALVKRFGFSSGREMDKFNGFKDYQLDRSGNPLLDGDEIAATFSLKVYDTVDLGTHTLFLCDGVDAVSKATSPLTYWDYRASFK